MKRLISTLCSVLLVLSCFVFVPNVSASELEKSGELVLVSETVKYLEDGSSIITSVYEEVVQTRSNLYTKTGSRIDRYVSTEGEVVWSLTVYGEFQVIEGASVTCTSARSSATIYDSEWECVTQYAYVSGNQATAHGEFQRKLLGVVISSRTVDVTLSCDPYGNLY